MSDSRSSLPRRPQRPSFPLQQAAEASTRVQPPQATPQSSVPPQGYTAPQPGFSLPPRREVPQPVQQTPAQPQYAPQPVEPVLAAPETQTGNGGGNQPPKPPKKNNNGGWNGNKNLVAWLYTGVAVILSIVIVVAGITVINNSRSGGGNSAAIPESVVKGKNSVMFNDQLPDGVGAVNVTFPGADSFGWVKGDDQSTGSTSYLGNNKTCSLLLFVSYVGDSGQSKIVKGDSEATTYNLITNIFPDMSADKAKSISTNEALPLADSSGVIAFKKLAQVEKKGSENRYQLVLTRAFLAKDLTKSTVNYIVLTCGDQKATEQAWDNIKPKLAVSFLTGDAV